MLFGSADVRLPSCNRVCVAGRQRSHHVGRVAIDHLHISVWEALPDQQLIEKEFPGGPAGHCNPPAPERTQRRDAAVASADHGIVVAPGIDRSEYGDRSPSERRQHNRQLRTGRQTDH